MVLILENYCLSVLMLNSLCHCLPHVKHLHVICTVEQNVTYILYPLEKITRVIFSTVMEYRGIGVIEMSLKLFFKKCVKIDSRIKSGLVSVP